jgi:hypothetical protein
MNFLWSSNNQLPVSNSKTDAFTGGCPEKNESALRFVIQRSGTGSSTLASLKDHVTPLGAAAVLFAAVLLWRCRAATSVEA